MSLRKIRVGVDLDEVLVQFCDEMTKYYNAKFSKTLGSSDYDGRQWSDVWQMTQDQVNDLIHEFAETEIFDSLEPVPGSIETLKRLKMTNQFEFFIITARGNHLNKKTHVWVKKHFDNIFTGIEFGNTFGQDKQSPKKREKADICRELKCDYLIDDMKSNLKNCSKFNIQGILFNFLGTYQWSGITPLSTEDIKHAFTWDEIEQILT